MKQKFVNVGFEFTAALTKGERIYPNFYRGYGSDPTIQIRSRQLFSKYKWIKDRFQTDACGCEVSTPIIKNLPDVTKYFQEFVAFTQDTNLSIDINKAVCGLGGCHIHLGIGFMPLPFRKRFLRNVGIFLTNHPQLNWAFNDPNDNCNANSLLTQHGLSSNLDINIFGRTNIETTCYGHHSLLEPFQDELINSNSIFNVVSVDFCISFSDDDYRHTKTFQKTLKCPMYLISFVLHIQESESIRIKSSLHNDPYKCLLDVKCRIENEIKLHKELSNMSEKLKELENVIIDEIGFLSIELNQALSIENYEKANEIKRKIEILSNGKKVE